MTYYRLHWDPDKTLNPCSELLVRDAGYAVDICEDDWLFVIAESDEPSLLARLKIRSCHRDPLRDRIACNVARFETTFCSRTANPLTRASVLEKTNSVHRTVSPLTISEAEALLASCERAGDYAFRVPPPTWPGLTRKIDIMTSRAIRDGDTRPSIEIAVDFLRSNYVTTELPGPAPVYLNAARLAIKILEDTKGTDASIDSSFQRRLRKRGPLTEEAIRKGINDDIATFEATSPDSTRHQEILSELRARLIELGYCPEYDGSIDCIITSGEVDIYFEVKSASHESFSHQLRLGVGQLLHYLWTDKDVNPRPVHGWLVIDDNDAPESYEEFLKSIPLGICWRSGIPNLSIEEFVHVASNGDWKDDL